MRFPHWLHFASKDVREAVSDSSDHLDRITAQAELLDPELARLQSNIERNHVVSNIMTNFKVVPNGRAN